jgi:hypothetical protein
LKGNINPVTLVARVVQRKVNVHPLPAVPPIKLKTTTNPAMMATRLMATWKAVKAPRKAELMGYSYV